MYQFMASFYNKITNNVSQGLKKGHMCPWHFLFFSVIHVKIFQGWHFWQLHRGNFFTSMTSKFLFRYMQHIIFELRFFSISITSNSYIQFIFELDFFFLCGLYITCCIFFMQYILKYYRVDIFGMFIEAIFSPLWLQNFSLNMQHCFKVWNFLFI
jgi:hypothetical protein